jgi:phosphoserine aminotransferase
LYYFCIEFTQMNKVHNFSAGPAILPQEAIDNSIAALKNFAGTGLSLLEVSHRGKEFVAVMDEACSTVKEIMNLDDSYEVLFLQGGASTQFLMVAYNLLNKKAAYLNTGTWAKKSIKEAKLFGEVDVVASSEDENFNYIPADYNVAADCDYFHITSNNTIFGTQIQDFPRVDMPLICDMSSDIFCREMDFSQFEMIYAGAQKNMGPAGTTLVIIKKDILGKVDRAIPSMLDYRIHIDKGSMFNTPPVFAIYCSLQTLKWVKKIGLKTIEANNRAKADALYTEIDTNPLFKGVAAIADRSIMNVTFNVVDSSRESDFLNACTAANINGIKGHRSVGGFRASIYNALTLESVQALIEVMRKF